MRGFRRNRPEPAPFLLPKKAWEEILSAQIPALAQTGDREGISARLRSVRQRTIELAAPLSAEDQSIQSMPDASPTKWHLAHTTWFFETFVLGAFARGYSPFDRDFGYLFNSYYEAEGPRHPRPERGLLSRPRLDEIQRWRAHVDRALEALVERAAEQIWRAARSRIELGLQHEQQHQELILMDIKHALSCNPLSPSYGALVREPSAAPPLEWIDFPTGLCAIGADGVGGFAFDHEGPRHRVLLERFRLASRLATNAEYLEFIRDGGYRRPEFWLSDGWDAVNAKNWRAPLYWREKEGGGWREFTLSGERALDPDRPVCHVSYYEADAFARWAGKRLPREQEWEAAAHSLPVTGHFASSGEFHPRPACGDGLVQMYGDAWEWTSSVYDAYPRYRPAIGALGEYNGKFMSGRYVLRGGACATPDDHIRPTYRNFFPPDARWAFSGIRLADDIA